MPLNESMQNRLSRGLLSNGAPAPKYGDDIFTGDYPRTWEGMIGQEQAKEQLQTAIESARVRNDRLPHIMLASGLHGIGKTTMAQIVAYEFQVGFVAVSGPLTVSDARAVFANMHPGDILFWDEMHLAVTGNRNRADWILPMLTDAKLLTKNGVEDLPDVTVIGATTDVGKLPQTIISRFMVRPRLENYTLEEAQVLAVVLSERMRVRLHGGPKVFERIAKAANHNPRDMRMILTQVRDLAAVGPVDLNKAFKWAGFTYDGLTSEAQDIILVLLSSKDHTAALETVQATLGEPGPLRHHEQLLLQKGLITITGRGRQLTDDGVERARLLLQELNSQE